MLDRIQAAWLILRGTHKAVPMDATWYVVNTVGHPPGFYVYTNGPGTSATSQINVSYGGSSQ